MTDIQRAVRFYYILKLSFTGRMQHYGYSPTRSLINLDRIPTVIDDVHARLNGVNIECLDFADCIKRYDRPGTLFYVDPPYWDADDYRIRFSKEDHIRLHEALSKIKGKFLLSMNDVPEIRELYKEFNTKEISVFYSLSREKRSHHPELLIANYDTQNV